MKKLLFLGLTLSALSLTAQVKIGENLHTIGVDSALELESATRAMVLTRVANVNEIVSPVNGMIVYDMFNKCVRAYENGSWSTSMTGKNSGTFIPNNNNCEGNVISISSCATLGNATLNDDVASTVGVEYDWTDGVAHVGTATKALVEINGQCWYAKNAINVGSSSGTNHVINVPGEGRLYSWNAAMNGSISERAQGVCATGFHIASDCEWMFLENSLGMSALDQQKTVWRANPSAGLGVGSRISTMVAGDGAKNDSGFSAVLSGYTNGFGNSNFTGQGENVYMWTSTTNGNNAYQRHLQIGNRGLYRSAYNKDNFGFIVRCLKD